MTPHEFFTHWSGRLNPEDRDQFMVELSLLLSVEQAQERRRLCTDRRLYREACEQTMAELRQHGQLVPDDWKASA